MTQTIQTVDGVEDAINVVSPADIANETQLRFEVCQRLVEAVLDRKDRRDSGRAEVIIVLEDWALEYPPDDPIASSTVYLVGKVEDYSDKSYKVRGAHEVDTDAILEQPLNLSHRFLDYVEEGNGGGTTWLPKSAVIGVFVI